MCVCVFVYLFFFNYLFSHSWWSCSQQSWLSFCDLRRHFVFIKPGTVWWGWSLVKSSRAVCFLTVLIKGNIRNWDAGIQMYSRVARPHTRSHSLAAWCRCGSISLICWWCRLQWPPQWFICVESDPWIIWIMSQLPSDDPSPFPFAEGTKNLRNN